MVVLIKTNHENGQIKSKENGYLDGDTLPDGGDDFCRILVGKLAGRKIRGGEKLVDNRADLIGGVGVVISADRTGTACQQG